MKKLNQRLTQKESEISYLEDLLRTTSDQTAKRDIRNRLNLARRQRNDISVEENFLEKQLKNDKESLNNFNKSNELTEPRPERTATPGKGKGNSGGGSEGATDIPSWLKKPDEISNPVPFKGETAQEFAERVLKEAADKNLTIKTGDKGKIIKWANRHFETK